jgi:uncharacterized membrane protein
MNQTLRDAVEAIGIGLELVGVGAICVGVAVSTVGYVRGLAAVGQRSAYLAYRANLARSVLLGLEFLVAGDILRTVVVEPTLANVGVLALIVLIRTFLSMTLEMELGGRWPWRRADHGEEHGHGPAVDKAVERQV